MGDLEVTRHTLDGEPYTTKLAPDPAFMKLYLDRVYGPVAPIDDSKVDRLVEARFEQLVAEARKQLEARQLTGADLPTTG